MNNHNESASRIKKARQGLARRLNRLPLLAPFVVGAAIVANAITLVQPNYDWEDIVTALGIVLGICGVVTWLSYRLFRRVATSAFAAILTLLMLAYFNTIEAKILEWLLNSPFRFLARAVSVIGLMGLIYAGLIWWFDKQLSRRRRINLAVNMAAVAMLAIPVLQVATAWYKYRHLTAEPYWASPGSLNLTATNKPDIYFIILDSYTSNESLKKYWNYDNSEFTEFLRSHGFYIASNALSHATWTCWSISASFNMDYNLKNVPKANHLYCWLSGTYRVNKSYVPRVMKRLGYEICNISPFYVDGHKPFYEFSVCNAGKCILEVISNQTFVGFMRKVLNINNRPNFFGVETLAGFERAHKLVEEYNGFPRFIYLHTGIPHPPFVFDQNGVTGPASLRKKDYVGQVKYTNKKCMELIRAIIKKSADAIIIIGGDHGSRLLNKEMQYTDTQIGLMNPHDENVNNKYIEAFTIFKAFRLPVMRHEDLWDKIMPVDDFRLVLNHYFGANYPYLSKPTNATETVSAPEVPLQPESASE